MKKDDALIDMLCVSFHHSLVALDTLLELKLVSFIQCDFTVTLTSSLSQSQTSTPTHTDTG